MIRMNWLLALCAALGLTGCGESITGTPDENLPPETHTIVKEINRSGENRFVSQVEIQWWGDDPDGFVKGYEYSFDEEDWSFTRKQDSIFFIQLPEGADTFDFQFYVRAVDNNDLVDQTPASLVYPVKNSAPEIEFAEQPGTPSNPSRSPRKTFPIIQFQWNATDRDGDNNIEYFEFFANDTTGEGIRISKDFSSLTIEAKTPEEETTDCKILLGATLQDHTEELKDLPLNSQNRFYIRAVDKVGAKSLFASSKLIYVKRKVSDVLLINAYSSAFENRENFYLENFRAAGITNLDTMRVNEIDGTSYTQLAADNQTQGKIFALFDVLVWFGSDAPYTLTLAQRTTNEFLNNGGKMFASVFFSTGIDPLSSYLDFTPIDSLVEPSSGVFFMDKDAEANAVEGGWPSLQSPRIITSTRPFFENFSSEPLYEAELKTVVGDWEGKSTIMAKSVEDGETRFIISSIELYRLNGNDNMPAVFDKIFGEELGLK